VGTTSRSTRASGYVSLATTSSGVACHPGHAKATTNVSARPTVQMCTEPTGQSAVEMLPRVQHEQPTRRASSQCGKVSSNPGPLQQQERLPCKAAADSARLVVSIQRTHADTPAEVSQAGGGEPETHAQPAAEKPEAEEPQVPPVKVFVLETRSGETAVAVERADGKKWRFMRNAIDFELQCSSADLQTWLDSLVSEQLPGLLTLLGSEIQSRGSALKSAEKERDALRGTEDYSFFGLNGDTCTEKDIDRAYRQKSTQLHPDKGGNEESFNNMREKYEQLKSLRGEGKRKDGGGSIRWDAASRASMLQAHGELRDQLVWITRHLTEVEGELQKLHQRQAAKFSLPSHDSSALGDHTESLG